MLGRVHFAMSLLISYVLFYLLFDSKIIAIILSIIVASFSSIPDYDWKIYSWANRKYLFFQKHKLIKYLLFPIYLVVLFLIKVFKHRTTTHSLLIVLAIYLLGKIINIIVITQLFILISLAMFLHIIEDCFTISGVPLFYPLSKRTFKIPIINTKEDKGKQMILEKISYVIFILILFLI